jgi:hypothetical protein
MPGKKSRTKLTSVKIATRQGRKGGAGKNKSAKQRKEEEWFDKREKELAVLAAAQGLSFCLSIAWLR